MWFQQYSPTVSKDKDQILILINGRRWVLLEIMLRLVGYTGQGD